MNSLLVIPLATEKRAESEFSKAAHGRRHLALKRLSAHLAVGHDFQPDALLQRDRLVHRVIFYFFEFNRGDGPSGELLLGGKQFRGPEKAADDVGVASDHIFLGRNSMAP